VRFFDAAFAPCAATRRSAIRVAQFIMNGGESAYEAFAPEAFQGWGQYDIPILIDHDGGKLAGKVTSLVAHGDWHVASFMLDGPYANRAALLIERCGKVSPGFDPLEKDARFAVPITQHHTPIHWHTRAKLNEISILSPSSSPWYVGAKVERAYPPQPEAPRQSLAVRHQPEPEPEGEVIYGDGTLIRRYYDNVKITIR